MNINLQRVLFTKIIAILKSMYATPYLHYGFELFGVIGEFHFLLLEEDFPVSPFFSVSDPARNVRDFKS
jgi:hypothetical protein